MGKSPGKWIKTVLFGKKSSKSNLSKDATLDIKTSITAKAASKDFDSDSIVISSPVPPVIDSGGEHTELEKSSSANITCDTTGYVTNPIELNAANDDELIKLEQAATKAQAAFRGYLARRAFWALKGIIRLQALVRGHLVRRQAVATLSCMRAIVEFQALVRGRKARLSGNGQVLQKYTPGVFVDKKRAELLLTSLRVEKLSTNVFGTKLVASSHNTTPLSIQYDPIEPNSARSWLERWSVSSFWEPLPQLKKPLDVKPKRKPTKLQTEETELGRPKRSVRRIPAANFDNNNNNNNNNHSSDNEKSKRTIRKISNSHQVEPVLEQSHNELERVKRNLRKISISIAPEKSDIVSDDKVSTSLNPDISEQETHNPFVESVKDPEPDVPPVDPPVHDDKPLDVLDDPVKLEMDEKVENEAVVNVNVELNGKENLKTRRRKSLPVKQEYNESCVSQNTAALPSYMAATESAKAKLRAQAAAKAAEEGSAENGFSRRHSLPSSTGKVGLHSPRVQKPLQVNGKGGSKSNKIAPRDEKVLQTGWRR